MSNAKFLVGVPTIKIEGKDCQFITTGGVKISSKWTKTDLARHTVKFKYLPFRKMPNFNVGDTLDLTIIYPPDLDGIQTIETLSGMKIVEMVKHNPVEKKEDGRIVATAPFTIDLVFKN